MMSKHLWLDANVRGGGGGGGAGGEVRSKYKSCYMKQGFSSAEAACLYKHLTRTMPGVDLTRSTVSADSYGGAINKKDLINTTSIPQRASIMKLQFLTYWNRPEDDQAHMQWIRDLFCELYSGPDANPKYKETPYWNDRYEGCYINYPDRDMVAYPFWQELYYGETGLVPALKATKQKYDPNNIFHHAMSIRA